ncbi:MAG: hypothetical protein ACRDIB_19505 [Ardenticatenaceae bacterium]
MKRLVVWFVMGVLLVACQSGPPEPVGATVGDIPIIEGAEPLDPDTLPMSLIAITQVHSETVDDEAVGHFRVEMPLLDTIEWYDDELERFEWRLVDVLEFGDGGFVRRYHRGQQRVIVAFEPEDDYTRFLLMQGEVR